MFGGEPIQWVATVQSRVQCADFGDPTSCRCDDATQSESSDCSKHHRTQEDWCVAPRIHADFRHHYININCNLLLCNPLRYIHFFLNNRVIHIHKKEAIFWIAKCCTLLVQLKSLGTKRLLLHEIVWLQSNPSLHYFFGVISTSLVADVGSSRIKSDWSNLQKQLIFYYQMCDTRQKEKNSSPEGSRQTVKQQCDDSLISTVYRGSFFLWQPRRTGWRGIVSTVALLPSATWREAAQKPSVRASSSPLLLLLLLSCTFEPQSDGVTTCGSWLCVSEATLWLCKAKYFYGTRKVFWTLKHTWRFDWTHCSEQLEVMSEKVRWWIQVNDKWCKLFICIFLKLIFQVSCFVCSFSSKCLLNFATPTAFNQANIFFQRFFRQRIWLWKKQNKSEAKCLQLLLAHVRN